MMYLCLDNSAPEAIILYHSAADRHWISRRYPRDQYPVLLLAVASELRARQATREALGGLFVLVGQGGFSSTRAAVTVINTLGYAWQIPVGAVTTPPDAATIARPTAQPLGQYVSARYSAPPRIGRSNSD